MHTFRMIVHARERNALEAEGSRDTATQQRSKRNIMMFSVRARLFRGRGTGVSRMRANVAFISKYKIQLANGEGEDSMSTMTQSRVQALIDTIQERIAGVERITDLDARHNAIFDVVPTLKAEAEQALADDPDALKEAMDALRDAFDRFKHANAIPRLPYSSDVDARYPYRDALGQPVHIAVLWDATSKVMEPISSHASNTLRIEDLYPYVDPRIDNHTRGQAYENMLYSRKIVAADLRDEREYDLIGQRGVFAARRIQAGECLGVYGGRLMSAAMFFCCVDDTFVLDAAAGASVTFVDGENILAMANTSLAYNADGKAVCQADDRGYNMEARTFHASSYCGRQFSIRAFFASQAIASGTELRWNYRYSPDMVRHVFGRADDRG